jgi:hypothetical protein
MPSRRTLRAVPGAALLAGALATLPTISQPIAAQESQPVTIHSRAMVGDEPSACGKRDPGIGTTGATITPADFRFYVSDIALTTADGLAAAPGRPRREPAHAREGRATSPPSSRRSAALRPDDCARRVRPAVAFAARGPAAFEIHVPEEVCA